MVVGRGSGACDDGLTSRFAVCKVCFIKFETNLSTD